MMANASGLDLSLTPGRVLWFLAFAIITGFLAGFLPAMHFSRLNPIDAIKNNVPSKAFSVTWLRKALIVFQFTLCLFFILSLVMALNLAMFLNDPKTNLVWGATAGFLAGFGWVAMGIGIVSLFERRPWSYVLVNGGYLTVALVVMGAILGGWR